MAEEKKNKNKREFLPVETAEDLYENAPCGYVSFLSDGSVFNINKTLLSWLGYQKEEIINIKKFPALFKIGSQIFFETHFFPLIRIQGFVKEINFDIVKKDGTSFPCLINVNEISGKAGPKSYRATIFDITDRKKYEQELLDARKKAESASKMKSEFLATISHEIRTPLNALMGIANLIQKTPLNPQQKEYSRILLLSSENLLELVNNLLDLSKIEAQKVTLEERPFSLSDMVTVLENTFEVKAAEKDIDLLIQIAADVPEFLLGDPVKLNQILTNLLGNAIKFTERGYVKLEISLQDKTEETATLFFVVSDTGIGIPEEKQQLIFEEFSQASYDVNLTYGGTGLGLTISQKLLKLFGSEMKVESEEGKGSRFSFELSLKPDPTPPVEKKINPVPLYAFEAADVLVVDDNEVNLYIISEFLREWNLRYDTVENGAQAVKSAQEKEYDLILMDLHMPKMNGYEAAAAIRQLDLKRQPAIIALSASGRGDVNLKQQQAGFDAYVPKPFRPTQLLEVLAQHLQASTKKDPMEDKKVPQQISAENNDATPPQQELSQETPLLSFELSRYVKMANNNPHYLQKFIDSTTKAFEEYRKNFTEAAREKSSQKMAEMLHRCTMTFYYSKAEKVNALLEEYHTILESAEASSETEKEKETEVLAEFDHIIKNLRAVTAEDLLKQ